MKVAKVSGPGTVAVSQAIQAARRCRVVLEQDDRARERGVEQLRVNAGGRVGQEVERRVEVERAGLERLDLLEVLAVRPPVRRLPRARYRARRGRRRRG